jgi:hypothetical protein
MTYSSLPCFPILTSSLSPSTCFLSRMGITCCKFGYLTSIVCTMMSLPSTSMLIPLSLILSWVCWALHCHDETK